MTEEQWFGLLFLILGIYCLICSLWKRKFILYRLKAQRIAGILEEAGAHAFYCLMGAVLVAGGLKLRVRSEPRERIVDCQGWCG